MNTYFKNNLDLKIYRFKSMLRLVYTNKTISNRIARDFLESKNNDKMIKFKKFINDQKYIFLKWTYVSLLLPFIKRNKINY